MPDLNAIKQRYDDIVTQLAARSAHVGFHETPQHDGSPHVETQGDELLFVVTERGSRLEERRTKDPDELLYWLISGVTFSMAVDYELAHRIEHEDCRRQIFAKDLELLGSVNQAWADRKRAEYDEVLKAHPFNNGLG